MDGLYCAAFVCTFPLNSIAACLTVSAVALLRGGLYLRTAIAAYSCWMLMDPSPTKGGYEPLDPKVAGRPCFLHAAGLLHVRAEVFVEARPHGQLEEVLLLALGVPLLPGRLGRTLGTPPGTRSP